ncbi:MAG: maleylacetoacetate isomerase [Alphaproteobacteria bacterium]|jgi:maleylacetoacetate isomerase
MARDGARLTLYSNFVNSAGERVRIALGLKGLDYKYVSVREIGLEAYRAINPQALMPTLVVDGQAMAQATAILEYLEETYPDPALLPEAPTLRAQARAFAQHITSEMHAVDVIRIRRFLNKDLGIDEAGLARWQRHWFDTGFRVLETNLADRDTAWPYCFGETPGWADLHLVPQVRKAISRFNIDMTPFPLIADVYKRCTPHPAFIAATPEQQPDYEGPFVEPSLDNAEGME